MQKKIAFTIYIVLAIALTITWIYVAPFTRSEPVQKFAPISGKHDETKLDRNAMRQWMSDMHRAAPGVDYRKIDRETRMQRRFSGRMAMDSLAGGKIVGEWIERGCNVQSGRIVAAEYDSTTAQLYCFSAGGTLWKGNMNGTNWQPLNDHQSIPSPSLIKFVQNGSARRILAGTTSKYFFYSDDEGVNWDTAQGLSNVVSWGGIRRTVVKNDSINTIFILSQEWDYTNWLAVTSIYKSVDKGSSFSLVTTFPENIYGDNEGFDLWTHSLLNNEVFLLHEDSLFTIDAVSNQIQFRGNINTTATGRTLLTGTVIDGTTYLYAYIDQKVFRSNNGGVTWVQKSNTPETPFHQTSFNCSLTDSNAVFFGGVDCYRTWDGGDYWPRVNYWYDYYPSPEVKLHADIPSIHSFMVNGQETQVVCTDAALYKSTNKLYTVQNLGMIGLNASRLYDSYTRRSDPTMIYVGTQDQGYQRTDLYTPGHITFEQVISGDYGHIVSSDGGENIWMVYPGFAAFWEDAAYSFTNLTTWDFNDAEHFWIPPLMADPDNPYECYMAGRLTGSSGSYMIKLTYNGSISATQMSYNFSSLGGGNVSAMAYSPIDNNHWYVLTDEGNFYHSPNKGQSWTRHTTSGPGAHYFYGSTIHPSASELGVVYIGGSGYSNPAVFRSSNHGVGFQALTNGLPSTLVYELSGDENDSLIFAATEVGPYCYVVSDNQWHDLTTLGAPDQTYWTVDYVESIKTARFGTYGRGMWDFKLHQSGIGTEELTAKAIKCYPNPTSDYLVIENTAGKSAELYDLRGRKVLEERIGSEKHRMDISKLESGSYLLVVDGQRRNAQMIIKSR